MNRRREREKLWIIISIFYAIENSSVLTFTYSSFLLGCQSRFPYFGRDKRRLSPQGVQSASGCRSGTTTTDPPSFPFTCLFLTHQLSSGCRGEKSKLLFSLSWLEDVLLSSTRFLPRHANNIHAYISVHLLNPTCLHRRRKGRKKVRNVDFLKLLQNSWGYVFSA